MQASEGEYYNTIGMGNIHVMLTPARNKGMINFYMPIFILVLTNVLLGVVKVVPILVDRTMKIM